MIERRKNRYMDKRASAVISGYIEKSGRTMLQEAAHGLKDELAERLSEISAGTFEKMLIERAYEKKLLLAMVRGEAEEKVAALRDEFINDLLKNGDEILREKAPELLDAVLFLEQRYVSVLEEFCIRYEKNKQKIEEVLFNGKTIHHLTEITLLAGDSHNHGRGTAVVTSDAGKFIYRPRDMQIDEISARFFRTFFPEITALPETVLCDGYGYCSFIENKPACSLDEAAEYYHNVGVLLAVVLLLRSRDLHFENMLASGTRPVPIDLEMMISPLEAEAKMGASPKDVNWEETVCGSGFLSYRVRENETGVLFSTQELNRSAPVINGEKITVVPFEKEFLEGFEEGYRRVMARKEEICRFFLSLPPVKIRVLIRGTQPYYALKLKTQSYDRMRDKQKREYIKQTLEKAFLKLGAARFSAIIESETDALLEDDIPAFYTLSDGHGIWDAEKCLYENYYKLSAVENVIRALNEASEKELRFESAILKKAIARVLIPKDAEPECKAADTEEGVRQQLEQTAFLLADAVLENGIRTPKDDMLWFGVDDKYSATMHSGREAFGMGSSGIAVFLSAACSVCGQLPERKKLEDAYDMIMLRMKDKLESDLCMDGPYYENVVSPGLEKGIGGILLSNELVAGYSGKKYCEEIRNLCISILKRMDFTYSRNDMMNGIAGLIRVLCSFETLSGADGIPELVEKLCSLLLDRREKISGELLLWKNTDQNHSSVVAFPGYANGQAGMGAALSIAGKRLQKKKYQDAAEMTAVFADEMFDEQSGFWQSLQKLDKKSDIDTGILNGAAGMGFAMLHLDSETGKRNLGRAISLCSESGLTYLDTLRDGNCAVIDFLIEASVKLNRPELLELAREKMAKITARSARNGDFHYIREAYQNFFETGMSAGAAGVGYTCLRCLFPEKIKSIY